MIAIGTKTNRTISVDAEIWARAKEMYPGKISDEIEKFLKKITNTEGEIQILKEKKAHHEKMVRHYEKRISDCELILSQKKTEYPKHEKTSLEKATDICIDRVKKSGKLDDSIIGTLSQIHNVNPEMLEESVLKELEEQDIIYIPL